MNGTFNGIVTEKHLKTLDLQKLKPVTVATIMKSDILEIAAD